MSIRHLITLHVIQHVLITIYTIIFVTCMMCVSVVYVYTCGKGLGQQENEPYGFAFDLLFSLALSD